MLNIYTNKNVFNNTNYIHDVEDAFGAISNFIFDCPYFKDVINNIEKGKVLSKYAIQTRFGVANIGQICTGSKALLLALYASPAIINFREAGDNVVLYAIELSKVYDIYIYFDRIININHEDELLINCNGKLMTCEEYNKEV